MNSYMNAMRRYFEFSGRSSRAEFWLAPFVITLVGIMMMGGSIFMMMSGSDAATVAGLATMGAGFLFIAVIDLIIAIVALVFYVTPGTAGPNSYGPAPTV